MNVFLSEQILDVKAGDIVQVKPHVYDYGMAIVVVAQVFDWGIRARIYDMGVFQEIKMTHSDYEKTGGRAVWIM